MRSRLVKFDKEMDQDLARADDDGLAIAENNPKTQSADQDSDCWSDLWQRIKAQGARFHRYLRKTNE